MPLSGPVYSSAYLVRIQLIGVGGGFTFYHVRLKFNPGITRKPGIDQSLQGGDTMKHQSTWAQSPFTALSDGDLCYVCMSVLFFQKVC